MRTITYTGPMRSVTINVPRKCCGGPIVVDRGETFQACDECAPGLLAQPANYTGEPDTPDTPPSKSKPAVPDTPDTTAPPAEGTDAPADPDTEG